MWKSIEGTSLFNEIEDIWDEIAYISWKMAYDMKLETLGFIFRYQKSILQSPRKSFAQKVCTILVNKIMITFTIKVLDFIVLYIDIIIKYSSVC